MFAACLQNQFQKQEKVLDCYTLEMYSCVNWRQLAFLTFSLTITIYNLF